jgi:hypothetical protein
MLVKQAPHSTHQEVATVDDILYRLLQVLRLVAVQGDCKLGRAASRHDLTAGPTTAEPLDSHQVENNVNGGCQGVGDQEVLLPWCCRRELAKVQLAGRDCEAAQLLSRQGCRAGSALLQAGVRNTCKVRSWSNPHTR